MGLLSCGLEKVGNPNAGVMSIETHSSENVRIKAPTLLITCAVVVLKACVARDVEISEVIEIPLKPESTVSFCLPGEAHAADARRRF